MILKEKREVINAIKKFGHRVIIIGDDKIEESIWVFTAFKEADAKTRIFHTLHGKDITNLVQDTIQITDKDILYQKIEKIQSEEVWIHKDIRFMTFVNTLG